MESNLILPGHKDFSLAPWRLRKFSPGEIKPERKYRLMERLGAELGIPVPQTFIKVEATNPDGSPGTIYEDRSRTFNRNYWNLAFKFIGGFYGSDVVLTSDATFGAGHLATKSTAAAVSNASSNPIGFITTWNTTTGNLTGIVVGTGVAAESFEDAALGAIIASGASSGQLNYTAMSISGNQPSYNAGTKVWTATISRIFNNNSGGTITIGETALYADTNNLNVKHMICRDKLGATVPVLTAGQLTVTYTTTLTFPA